MPVSENLIKISMSQLLQKDETERCIFFWEGGGGISSLVQIQFCAVVTCLSSASCASHLSRHKKQGCIFRLAVNLSTDGLLLFLYSFKELHGYASCHASHPHTAFTDLHPFSRTH